MRVTLSKPPKPQETEEARAARIASRGKIGVDILKNIRAKSLLTQSRKRSGLLGGTETGLATVLGIPS